MKWLTRGVVGLVVLVVVAVGAVAFYLNAIVGGAIERAGTYALGVETSVGAALVRPFAGSFTLTSLEIANPPGFEDDFVQLGHLYLAVDTNTLGADTVVVPELTLEDIAVTLQRNAQGRLNYQVILDHASKLGGAAPKRTGEEEPATGEGGGPKLVVRKLAIRNVTADIDLLPELAQYDDLQVVVPEIALTNVGEKSGGVRVEELVTLITTAVLEAVAAKSGDLPGDVAARLRGLTGQLDRIQAGIGESLAITRQIGGTAEELSGAAQRATDAVKKGLGGLLGGDDD